MTKRHGRPIAARAATVITTAILTAATLAGAADRTVRASGNSAPGAAHLESKLQTDSVPAFVLDHLKQLQGPQTVIVQLSTAPAALGGSPAQIAGEQQAFIAHVQAAAPSAQVVASVKIVLNAVFLNVDDAGLDAISSDASVSRVAPVGDYRLDLTATVPYIGAETVHGLGIRGAGVRVAVLDSGIDYTHADLGGTGNPADFGANDPATTADGGFPNSKVVGGTDFVGGTWNGTRTSPPLAPDADPLDKAPTGFPDGSGHGTHVASIIAGAQGVAPDASLYAVKVCSSVSTACSGTALIEGMEFAVDPNGDGDTSDHVDIVNMSLGLDYGQPFDDDLSFAVDNATAVGVLTAAAAGNGGDRPFVTGTPAAAPTAISVAQTAVPSEKLNFMHIDSPALTPANRGAVFQPWAAPLTSVVSGTVLYGNGASNRNGCAAFAPGSVTGRIVLVDRGSCSFSVKISNIAAGGAALGIIGTIDATVPFTGAFDGGTPTIPGFMISLADANAIRGGATVTFDPANTLAVVGSVTSTSSRGPSFQDKRIKPEISAPGASVSSEHGTGTGRTAFGGTSGATPMISGSAALLKQFYNIIGEAGTPKRIKQALLDSAETGTLAPLLFGGVVPDGVAPISRIGGGEVRVDRAVSTATTVNPLDRSSNNTGGLSFGFIDAALPRVIVDKDILIANHSYHPRTFSITPTARFADDVATGAVSLSLPSSVTLGPLQNKILRARLTVNSAKLRNNLMNSGSGANNHTLLRANEYDGYVVFHSAQETITLPWHVLPRKDALVLTPYGQSLRFGADGSGSVKLANIGVGTAQPNAYSLIAVSANLPQGGKGQQSPTPDIRAIGVNTVVDSPDFVTGCDAQFYWEFAINSWERQTMPTDAIYDVLLDIDGDGIADWDVFNFDLSLSNSLSDGRQVTWAIDTKTGTLASAFFFVEHSTNSANTVLRVCGEQVGLASADILTRNVGVTVFASDFFFGGPGDEVDGLTITPFGEQFVGFGADVPAAKSGTLSVFDFGAFPGNTPELGLMLFNNSDRGPTSRGGATRRTETLYLSRPGCRVNFDGPDSDSDSQGTSWHHHHKFVKQSC